MKAKHEAIEHQDGKNMHFSLVEQDYQCRSLKILMATHFLSVSRVFHLTNCERSFNGKTPCAL